MDLLLVGFVWGDFVEVVPVDGVEDEGFIMGEFIFPLDDDEDSTSDRHTDAVAYTETRSSRVALQIVIFKAPGVFGDWHLSAGFRCSPVLDDNPYFPTRAESLHHVCASCDIVSCDFADGGTAGVAYSVD